MAKQMMISEILGNMEPKRLQELLCLPTPPKGGDAISPWELPSESMDNFSYDGLGFEEAAVQLWQHMLLLHELTGTANRHSDFFPLGMAQLEKDIRMAGSFCITRCVLEQQGQTFPNLPEMDVRKLLGLTAFYFRKCGKAFEDLYRIAGIVSVPMHDWERRWYLLSEQLKSTDLKIQKIRKGELKVEKLLARFEAESVEKKGPKPKTAFAETHRLKLNPDALPIIGSYARHMLTEIRKERKAMERYEARQAREERENTRRERGIEGARTISSARVFSEPIFKPHPMPKECLEEEGPDEERREAPPERTGPSDAVRKKLREKRKKRK